MVNLFVPERGKLLIPSVLELFLKEKKSYDKKTTFSLYEDLGCKSGMAVDLQGKKKDTGQREGRRVCEETGLGGGLKLK